MYLIWTLASFRESVSQLQQFDSFKRLLENEQAVGVAEFGKYLLPGVVAMRGADHYWNVWISNPKPRDDFDAVPAGWHSDVHERHGVRLSFLKGVIHLCQALVCLVGGVDAEAPLLIAVLWWVAKNVVFHSLQLGSGKPFLAKDFLKILMDGRIIIYDQDAIFCVRGVHRLVIEKP